MQAQDYAMAKWAIGLRCPGATQPSVDFAINNAEIIRTHLLRYTWHFVAAADLRWILDLLAGKLRASMVSRHKQLGLTEEKIAHSNNCMGKALQGGRQLTREELLGELKIAGFALDGNRASHLLGRAEIDGIICSGAIKGGKQTYALLDEWVPKAESVDRQTALAKLAYRYFSSHGPASLQDFTWWSGLSVAEARSALELAKPQLVSETIDSQVYWFTEIEPVPHSAPAGEGCYLLPAFDEYLISYKDRSAALPATDFTRAVSSNGIFWPVVVIEGKVRGIWKRTIKKRLVIIEVQFFEVPGREQLRQAEEAAGEYARFIGKEPEIKIQFRD